MSYRMKIFKAEKDAGIAEKVRASGSIAYATQLEPLDPNSTFGKKLVKATASTEHPSETLYPMRDILVSTGRNLNFDIFENGETYVARNTSIHHPLNFEHDEKRIIGNITSSQAVDDDMQPLGDDLAVDDLPAKFHIVNGSVIYRVWTDEEQQKLIDNTIAEIERGEWFVSMECVFRGFDYGVTRPDGSSAIIPRTEASAFLTKHLKQYGGDGIYRDVNSRQEFQIGRVLRNISFSGKGLVRKPANPESVILNHVSAFVSTSADLEYIKAETEIIPNSSVETTESKDMSEPNADFKRLQDRLDEVLREKEVLATQLKEKDDRVAQATIQNLKDEVTQKNEKIANLETANSELNSTIATLTTRAEAAESKKLELEEALATIHAERVQQNRVAILTGKGASAEKAAELVKKLSKFNDEEFNDIIESVSASWKKTTSKPETVLNNAKPDREASMATVVETEEESEQAVAKAAAFIGGFLRYNKPAPTQD